MNCYRNVRRACGRGRLEGWAEAGRSGVGDPARLAQLGNLEARHAWGSVDGRLGVSLILSFTVFCTSGHDAPPAHQDPLLQKCRESSFSCRRHCSWGCPGDPVGGQDPGPGECATL